MRRGYDVAIDFAIGDVGAEFAPQANDVGIGHTIVLPQGINTVGMVQMLL